jgi:hypothetical protein
MRSKIEVQEELKYRITQGETEVSNEEIIMEFDNMLLVRRLGAEKIDNNVYLSTRYEIWSNKEKYEKGIHGEDGFIYCQGIGFNNDEEAIQLFQRTA